MRIDPPPSDPVASGTRPAATAAADPPDDPPADRSSAHGLRVAPNSGLTVSAFQPSSGVFVLPTTTQPAARRRSTSGESVAGGRAVGEGGRSAGGDEAGGVLEVLDAERHAGERADVLAPRDALVDRARLGQRRPRRRRRRTRRARRRVGRCCRARRRGLAGRQRPVADLAGEVRDRGAPEVHGAAPYRPHDRDDGGNAPGGNGVEAHGPDHARRARPRRAPFAVPLCFDAPCLRSTSTPPSSPPPSSPCWSSWTRSATCRSSSR